MSDDFTKNIALVTVLTFGLVALSPLQNVAARPRGMAHLVKLIGEMHRGDLNADDFHALAGNYYEGIEHTNNVFLVGVENNDVRPTGNFLRYEYRPNQSRRYAAGMRVTNSMGMSNPEYGYDKPPHTRRIAVLGDSLSVGPYGENYVARLEERLNRDVASRGRKIQILNFSVPGYTLAQKLDVAMEKAPKFHPDAYILELSFYEIGGTATAFHVRRLWMSGIDLKYDYFRKVAVQAGLRHDDRGPRVDAKLLPFNEALVRGTTEQIRNHALSEGAPLIVVLMPAVIDASMADHDFDQLHSAIDGLGIPVIDLRDTFRNANLSELQVIPKDDFHPNVRGHEMLFKSLYARLQVRKDALAALTGN